MAGNNWTRLRVALIVAYIPAFALCVASGVVSNSVLPAIGLIPLSGSFVSAIVIIYKNHYKPGDGDQDADGRVGWARMTVSRTKRVSPLFLFLWDAFLASSLIAILVCTWVFFDFERRRTPGSEKVLASYATVPLLSSFLIHAFLALVNLAHVGKAIKSRWSAPSECPNCHARYHPSNGHVSAVRGPEDYTLARPSEEQQQPLFRDTSFDGDARIQPDEGETGSKAS